MGINLKDAIKSAVMTAPSSKWPTFDGGNLTRWHYLSASEASRCVRSLAFDKNEDKNSVPVDNYWEQFDEYEFKDMLDKVVPGASPLGVFARGHNVEAWIVEQLRAVEQDDELFLFLGDDQRSFYHNKHRISGTPDGIYINQTSGEMWLLEFKSSNKPITQPRAAHLSQVKVNMGLISALRSTHDFDELIGIEVPEKFTGAKLLYISSDDYIDLQEFDIEYDDGLVYNKMRAKSSALFNGKELRRPEELAPEGLKNNGCFFCKKKADCAAIESSRNDAANAKKLREMMEKRGSIPTLPKFKADMPREEVVELLLEYDRFSQDEKRAKEQKDALKDAIKVWVKAQDDTKVDFEDDGNVITASLSISKRAGGFIKEKVADLIASAQVDMEDFVKPDIDVETLRVKVKRVA